MSNRQGQEELLSQLCWSYGGIFVPVYFAVNPGRVNFYLPKTDVDAETHYGFSDVFALRRSRKSIFSLPNNFRYFLYRKKCFFELLASESALRSLY